MALLLSLNHSFQLAGITESARTLIGFQDYQQASCRIFTDTHDVFVSELRSEHGYGAPGHSDFNKLRIKFSRALWTPHIRERASYLTALVETGTATYANIEAIIASDPALTARTLSAGKGNKRSDHDQECTTIHGALRRMGLRNLRSMSVDLMDSGFTECDANSFLFAPAAYSRHSMFVGLMAQFLFDRAIHDTKWETDWTPDEVLTCGVLHDVADALFWMVDQRDYEKALRLAKSIECSLHQAFREIYGQSLSAMSALAIELWGLPSIFSEAIYSLDSDELPTKHQLPVYCVIYADWIAEMTAYRRRPWQIPGEPHIEIQRAVGLDRLELEHAIKTVRPLIDQHTRSFFVGHIK